MMSETITTRGMCIMIVREIAVLLAAAAVVAEGIGGRSMFLMESGLVREW